MDLPVIQPRPRESQGQPPVVSKIGIVGLGLIGGAARGGLERARPDLFNGRPWLLTPTGDDTAEAVDKLSAFVRALGAQPRIIGVDVHDRLLAFLSHLPQLTASALMQVVGEA